MWIVCRIKGNLMRQILSVSFLICILANGALSQNSSRRNLAQPDNQPKTNGLSQVVGKEGTAAKGTEEFVVGPEDILQIMVWHEPELSSPRVLIRPDGKIGLPLLNDVQASGLTPNQLQANINESLKAFVTDPNVSVIVLEIHSQTVFITGSVGHSGPYPLGSPMTVVELLVRAGGLADFAKSEDILILRKEGDKQSRYRFNYKTFADGRDYKQNILLRNGDMIIVP